MHTDNFSRRLSAIKLPQLPQVLVQLIDICKSDDVDIRLVAQTVAQDIAITTKTLKLANSAFLGARSQFKNIDQAVIFLGVDTVRNLAISVSVHEVFGSNIAPNGFHLKQFWYHCLLTALIAKTIAQKSGYDDPGAAYLTGLLHDTGKYLLCEHIGESYQDLLQQHSYEGDLVTIEREKFEISHCDVGKWMLDSWNLPQELGLAVRDHHNIEGSETETSVLGRILRLANTLTKKLDIYDEQTIKDSSILCIDPSTLSAIVEDQTTSLEELAQTLSISIQEPESFVPSASEKENLAILNDRIEIRAQLYGFMDNIIQAKTLNRVFLSLEESLSLLFNCKELVLLLPAQTGSQMNFQGSFRNIIAKNLKSKNVVVAIDIVLKNNHGDIFDLGIFNRPIVLAPAIENTELSPLYEVMENQSLLAVPIKISQDSQGILFIGLPSDNDPIVEQEETLQLLSNHVGNRLFQETLKEEYAASFAKERISAVEEMARSIAHEISNPLGVIQNYIALLAEKDGQDQQMNRELTIINKEIERIANVSSQLGDLSQIPQTTNSELVDINALLTDTANLYQHSVDQAVNISIDYNPVPQLPLLWVEQNPLKQILGNLITNSIDAIGTSGVIEIHCHQIPESAENTPGELVIVISDDGSGVPPSIANTIFRAGTTTKTNGHVGLGLAIVNKLTKDLSGRIYHSTSKQGHTQFNLHLPILKQSKK